MSWIAFITDVDGNHVQCVKCTHYPGCKVAAVVPNIAAILTSVDMCCDGHMATGTANLACNIFEPVPEDVADGDTVTETASAGSAEDVEGGSDPAAGEG